MLELIAKNNPSHMGTFCIPGTQCNQPFFAWLNFDEKTNGHSEVPFNGTVIDRIGLATIINGKLVPGRRISFEKKYMTGIQRNGATIIYESQIAREGRSGEYFFEGTYTFTNNGDVGIFKIEPYVSSHTFDSLVLNMLASELDRTI